MIGLALYHLKTTKEEVFVIFSSDGLRRRDLDIMADIIKFVDLTDKDFNTRV